MVSIPFDVQTPYRMQPGMRSLSADEPFTYQDQDYDKYIQQKREIMAQCSGENFTRDLEARVLTALQSNTLVEAITRYQEDFCVWAKNAQGDLSLQYASVCFPSGWRPEDKINKTFAEIHREVADNTMIMKAAEHISNMICRQGPYIRSVWNIANTGALSQHPDVKQPWSDETVEDCWYRAERQVTVPYGDFALFFIRVYTVPYLSLTALQQQQIRDSIASMSDSVLTYKSLHYVKSLL